MGEESEKRFHSIMDKLFHSPKSKPTSKLNSSSIREKSTSALSVMDLNSRCDGLRFQSSTVAEKSLQQAPLCRPWDRGDLLKRLATFKSMTWFGKPKVVNAISCARRGWINVDMDIIACESCGARLLFSNPSSWTRQQVEKAALVFSLKLDSGHKLLCPWIDNPCDEKLAQFPPLPAPALVEGYNERSSALLELYTLPIISSSTTNTMNSPQLEQFIGQSSVLEFGDGSSDTHTRAFVGDESEAVSANLYYQALKLISLCGWEPRTLPYMVDPTNMSNESAKTNEQEVHVDAAIISETMESFQHTREKSGLKFDPHSVVLDCKLCGATVGLWAFSTVPRPTELFRLVGYSEVGDEHDSLAGLQSSKDKPSTSVMTIAGGPPPTKQNFKATISLPIIGQNLKARFLSDSTFRDQVSDSNQSDSVSEKGTDHTDETPGMLKRKRHNDDHCDSTSNGQLAYSNNNLSEQGLIHEIGTCDLSITTTVENAHNLARESGQNKKLFQNEENLGSLDHVINSSEEFPVSNTSMETSGVEVTVSNEESNEENLSMTVAADYCNLQPIPEVSIIHQGEVSLVSNQDSSRVAASMKENITEGNILVGNTAGTQTNSLESDVVNNEMTRNRAKDRTQPQLHKELESLHKEMEFDAIKQHRHFCPWISSTGSTAPGWQQTLLAILRQKESSHLLSTGFPSSSSSMIEVDDPIASIRKLFMSPPSKRIKSTHNSG